MSDYFDDTSNQVGDWEKNICEMIDGILENPEDKLDRIEELIDYVEELVYIAYTRGKQNGQE